MFCVRAPWRAFWKECYVATTYGNSFIQKAQRSLRGTELVFANCRKGFTKILAELSRCAISHNRHVPASTGK